MNDPAREYLDADEGRSPDGPEAQAARQAHAFQSLLQLGSELSVSLGLFEAVDLLLFNLMGQFRVARSALWLLAEEDRERPVLIRSHGFTRSSAQATGAACARALLEHFASDSAPLLAWGLRHRLGTAEYDLLERARVALVAPVRTRQQVLGWLALGHKVVETPYTSEDLQVLEASLGFAGISIHNAQLYNKVLEANRQLQMGNLQLAELDRMKSEFVSNVNHEIRTPLAVVTGTLECLEAVGIEDAEARSMVSGALQSSNHLKGLIENLLMFSEMNRDDLPFRSEARNIRETLEAYGRERLPGVTAGLRELSCELPETLPAARFDDQRLRQVLDQLVDNAVKFTPRGSHIVIRAGALRVEGVDWVTVQVTDDGPGIPAARMGHLFNSFEQLDGSSTRKVGGLGMGLAMARQMAEHMGCHLTAASTLGKGSAFTLLVPTA